MDISSDYKDLFSILNKHKVKYLIIGAYATIYYTEPRFTKDMDIWVSPDEMNASKVYSALKAFGAPLLNISHKFFINRDMVYQIGVEPIRIDVLMNVSKVSFPIAWKNRVRSKYGGVSVNIINIKDLIKTKKATNRAQDKIDVEKLIKAKKHRPSKRS